MNAAILTREPLETITSVEHAYRIYLLIHPEAELSVCGPDTVDALGRLADIRHALEHQIGLRASVGIDVLDAELALRQLGLELGAIQALSRLGSDDPVLAATRARLNERGATLRTTDAREYIRRILALLAQS